MARASAPGKIILFGEHAVVYGRPALAVPVTQVAAEAQADWATDFVSEKRMGAGGVWQDSVWIEAPNIGLVSNLSALLAREKPHPLAVTLSNVFEFLQISQPPALKIRITSTIPVASGLGSGAAVSVALIRALAGLFERPLTAEQVNQLAYGIEKLHHGTPSGIDNTVITYAQPVYFVRGEPIETFHVARPLTLVIGDTGLAAPTRTAVGDLRKLWEADPSRWESVFDRVGEIVRAAKTAIESGQTESLGPLMDANQALLQEMTVSSPELDHLIGTARAAGALGAKLSGGGRGGNLLALVTPTEAEKVASALTAAGAKRTIITTLT